MESPASWNSSWTNDADSESAARSSILAMATLNSKQNRHGSQFQASASVSNSVSGDDLQDLELTVNSNHSNSHNSSRFSQRSRNNAGSSKNQRTTGNETKKKQEKLVCDIDPIVVIVYIFLHSWLILIAICLSCVYSGLGVELVDFDYVEPFGWLYRNSHEDNIFDVALQALGKEPDADTYMYAVNSGDLELLRWCGIFFGLMQCLCLIACVGLLLKLFLPYITKRKNKKLPQRGGARWSECKNDCRASGCFGGCFVNCVEACNISDLCESCELDKCNDCVQKCVECLCCSCPVCPCCSKCLSWACCCTCKLFYYEKNVTKTWKLQMSMSFLLILTAISAILWEEMFFTLCDGGIVTPYIFNQQIIMNCEIEYGLIFCYISIAFGVIVMCLFPVYTQAKQKTVQRRKNAGQFLSNAVHKIGDQTPDVNDQELANLKQDSQIQEAEPMASPNQQMISIANSANVPGNY